MEVEPGSDERRIVAKLPRRHFHGITFATTLAAGEIDRIARIYAPDITGPVLPIGPETGQRVIVSK